MNRHVQPHLSHFCNMLFFPNAKINLGLYVTGRRPDGFHNIESIFLPVGLTDVLEVVRAPKGQMTLEVHGMKVDGDVQQNICMKAAHLLQDKISDAGFSAHLLKHIPTGAGLGGGSSDGASMLRLLNEVLALSLSPDELKNLAAQLGSDCPFFIDNRSAHISGRGENVEPIDINLNGKYVVIVNPGIHVSTEEAYRLVRPEVAGYNLKEISTLDIAEWKLWVINVFEEPLIQLHPAIGEIKKKLYENGALYASMSGSGSSIYGIFNKPTMLRKTFPEYFCWEGSFL